MSASSPAGRQGAETEFVRWFGEIGIEDVALVGGKNASLGEMYRKLVPQGVRVPNGFAVTADAYRFFLGESGLDTRIQQLLAGLDTHDVAALRQRGNAIRQAVLAADLPPILEAAIVDAYEQLSEDNEAGVDVAVRSSATAEDLPDASFAGQQESYLNVRGRAQLLDTCRRCFASLFTDRAISYRVDRGFDHGAVALSIGVQRMVRSDLGASGVMFTIDTETGFPDAILINAAYGLGENVVKGTVNPDEFYVFKPALRDGYHPILRRALGTKDLRMVYDTGGGRMTRNVPVDDFDRNRFSINDDDILQLARWGVTIEDHYTRQRGGAAPMDIEWAKDGITGELFVVQARPETVQSQRAAGTAETYRLTERTAQLITGRSVGNQIAAGPVRVIKSIDELPSFQPGEVLVADRTDPDWEPVMKLAAAIVTNRGGRTAHAAIVSRELGLPAVVGTERATEVLRTGQLVTVSCAEGDIGSVYDGSLAFEVERIDTNDLPRPRTQVMLNVGNPSEAFRLAGLPNDGVGLVRLEFIISTHIGIHPLALLRTAELDLAVQAEIARRTAGYDDKPQFFVDRLAEGIAMIAAAFYPHEVIVRLSDFKSNEYANLIGGAAFEPIEANPMLGFRGAVRYYDDRYRDAFALECRALLRVRSEMGLRNVKVMVPFCRTVAEGRRVQEELARHGLRRGEDGLEVYVMCELPSNVVQLAAFAEVFDGFSIGSNDLAQFVLGVDRDSELVAGLFDERDPAVMAMVAQAIQAAKAAGTKIGLCGQAPSDYPEFARFLVEQGIDSISLNPDAVVATTVNILDLERALGRSARDVGAG